MPKKAKGKSVETDFFGDEDDILSDKMKKLTAGMTFNEVVTDPIFFATATYWLVVVDQFTPGYQFTPTPKFIQNNHS